MHEVLNRFDIILIVRSRDSMQFGRNLTVHTADLEIYYFNLELAIELY